MARTNLSLGNLYRATQGTSRSGQVSLNAMNASAGTQASMLAFAIDSVAINLPTYTYIVESTSEAATFTFGNAGSLHGSRVGNVAANYTVAFDNANFSVGSPTLGSSPSFPITPASIAASSYSEASSLLSMTYADGYNVNATNYNSTSTKRLYAVDVYNTINQPDFCLLFGTKIKKADGSTINVEDLSVGDSIKAWVPAGLPDENQDSESDQVDWRFYMQESTSGSYQDVNVADIVFNFASGYYQLNNGLIKATGTHPLWVWDSEIEKYHFKNVEDILIGDLVVIYEETIGISEVEVDDIAIINEDVEIVTINVENADVYLANGVVSHNKGTTTQPYIPSSGLRMYLDPSKASSTNGTDTTDWLDLSGWGTGVRPAGVQNAAGITGANPTYNNGATRVDKYWSLGTNKFWYKDGTTNINGGYTQFNSTAYSIIAWVRFTSHPSGGHYCIFNKSTSSDPASRIISLYLYSNGSGTYNVFDGVKNFTSSGASLSLNTWYMISYTAAENGTNVAYIDATSNGTVSNGANTFTSSGLINIGGNSNENNFYFNGQLGPVLFYNTQLSGTNIAQAYNYFSPTYK